VLDCEGAAGGILQGLWWLMAAGRSECCSDPCLQACPLSYTKDGFEMQIGA
jgi:hypothetical protein